MTTHEELELQVAPRSSGPLIPLGDGRFVLSLLKLSFVDKKREAFVECDFEVVKGGRTKIKKILIWGPDLSPSELRHYSLTRSIERAIAQVMLQQVEPPPPEEGKIQVLPIDLSTGPDTPPLTVSRPEPHEAEASARAVARRRRVTPERLQEVADVYRAAGGDAAGIKAVAATGCELRHARRLVKQARERNFLGEEE